MSRREPSGETDLAALLQGAKEVRRQPESVRARVLARARMTAALPLPDVASEVPHPRLPRMLVPAAAAVAAVGIAGTVLALSGGWRGHAEPRVSPAAATTSAVPPQATAAPPVATSVAPLPATSAVQRVERPLSGTQRQQAREDSYNAELELMRNAHTAFAAHDFSGALVLIGEHARRFPRGLLNEERDALRVRCLFGAGRINQARRAATDFATHFPRSVLARQLQVEVGADVK